MALNIFPRREKPAAPPAEVVAPPPPEPSPEALDDPKPRRRRGTRKAADQAPAAAQAASAPSEPAAPSQAPASQGAEPTPAPRRRRSRVAAIAETAEPEALATEAPAPPAGRPSGGTAREQPARPQAAAKAEPSPRTGRSTSPDGAASSGGGAPDRAFSRLANDIETLTRTLEVQAAQLAQLVRVQEDLARRIAQAPGAPATPPARIGVFVDAANIELALDRLKHRVDWKKMLDYLSEGRQLVRAIAYSPVHDDPGVSIETQRFAEPFLDHGYRVVTKPLRRFSDGTIKANVDIEMALDIMEMLDRLDVVVLVSGDGDFQRLVEVVQSKGVRVEVVAVGTSTASNLRNAADRFIDIQAILPKVRA